MHCILDNDFWITIIRGAVLFVFLSRRRKQAEQEEKLRREEKLKWVGVKMFICTKMVKSALLALEFCQTGSKSLTPV